MGLGGEDCIVLGDGLSMWYFLSAVAVGEEGGLTVLHFVGVWGG